MNIDSLRQTSAKLKYDIQTRYWPKLVVELESKSLRSLFFQALLLGLLVSVPWQCSRMVYNAYFTKTTEQQQEQGSPLASPEQNSGSITKMPDPRARRAAASPPPIALTEPKADDLLGFLQKMDVIPGKTNAFELTPDKVGTYAGKCAELCGVDHSRMLFNVKVVDRAEFDQYIADLKARGQSGLLDTGMSNDEGQMPGEKTT